MINTIKKILFILIILLNCDLINVFAEPKIMEKGIIFDSNFYANTYEDVKKNFGNNEDLLYKHYLQFGLKEGRLAYEKDFSTNFVYEKIGDCKNTQTMDDYIFKIPNSLKSFLFENNWKVYLTEENLAQTEFKGTYKSVMGLTNFSKKLIKIEDRQKAIEQSVLHEIGHALDFNSGKAFYSSNELFKDLYFLEKDCFLNVPWVNLHSISNTSEYFAECVQQYIVHTDSFKKNCPNTYLYIDNIFNFL